MQVTALLAHYWLTYRSLACERLVSLRYRAGCCSDVASVFVSIAFGFTEIVLAIIPLLSLTRKVGLISSKPSRTDTERAAAVTRRGTGRGGPQALTALDAFRSLVWRRTGRPRQGERTARVNVRATARTNGGRWQKQPSWDIQQADKSIRVRNAGEKTASEAPVQLKRSSLASAEPLPVYRCPFPTACGMPAWLAGGRESGFSPTRSARSLRGGKEQEGRLALWPR
jgi:hypothetical protein